MKQKIIILLLIGCFGLILWQVSGLIPTQVKIILPDANASEIASNQLFIIDPIDSHPPGTLTGCLYFPSLYNSKGKLIITTQGRRGLKPNVRYMELDDKNSAHVQAGDQVTLKMKADCIFLRRIIYTSPLFEKTYTVREKPMTSQEKISAQEKIGVDPVILKSMQEMDEIIKKADEEDRKLMK
jgi:hypothetical protein